MEYVLIVWTMAHANPSEAVKVKIKRKMDIAYIIMNASSKNQN